MRAQKSATVYLVRHGHSTANAKSILAGRDYSVSLSEVGKKQARSLAEELSQIKFQRIYSSPLPRCIQTVQQFAERKRLEIEILEKAIEMEYGDWSGKKLAILSRNKLWSSIQNRPSMVRFPKGESFLEMQARAVEGVRDIAIPGKTVLLCSHGDVIKAIVAGLIGLQLDNFQALNIDPASITVIEILGDKARLKSLNQTEFLNDLKFTGGKHQKLNLGGGGGATRE